MRTAAEQERERAAATMRAAYEQANSEISSVFGQASEKFNAATGEIRNLAQEIHRELEATRAEVRRGAQELPRETAEQASALRRVVGDQVKALNELTDIVARSGRAYDIAEAAPPPPRRFDAPRAESFRQEPPRAEPFRPEPPRAESFRPEPPRAETFRPEPPRAEPSRPEPPRAEPARPEPAARTRPAAPPPAPRPVARPSAPRPETNGQSGWLSNLLERASDEETPAAAAAAPRERPVGPLDNLTLDIARMVDTSAVAELWARHQRGEREGLFTRRLYTQQGRQTLEEIRRRYTADPDFRGTIDHYLRNFEELLAETSRKDRDGTQTLDLLTGDAGKVYTMLGHAAGRIE